MFAVKWIDYMVPIRVRRALLSFTTGKLGECQNTKFTLEIKYMFHNRPPEIPQISHRPLSQALNIHQHFHAQTFFPSVFWISSHTALVTSTVVADPPRSLVMIPF